MNQKISLVQFDDDPLERQLFKQSLANDSKLAVSIAKSTDEMKEWIAKETFFDVAILDVHVENSTEEKLGMLFASQIRDKHPSTIIIMRSSDTSSKTISKCFSAGADDYLSKSLDPDELILRIHQSIELTELKRGRSLKAPESQKIHPTKAPFVGKTGEKIMQRIPRIIHSAISCVLIEGESGTGKEAIIDMFAQELDEKVPLIRINCGAIQASLLESELFGHVKGAFTGANLDRQGYLEAAHGGWLFLDEVGTLTQSAQASLLRAIENQEIRRVGSSQSKKIKVRFLAATNENLEELVKKSTFRNDLLQRLSEIRIQLPPLRARKDEIQDLIQLFCKTMPGGPYQITEPAMNLLEDLEWKDGNIRQLRNCLRAMTELHLSKVLSPLSIPDRYLKEFENQDKMNIEKMTHKTSSPKNKHPEILDTELIPTTSDLKFVLEWSKNQNTSYHQLCDQLLIQMIEKICGNQEKISLRQLSKLLDYPRSSLTDRLKSILESSNQLPEAFNKIMNKLGL